MTCCRFCQSPLEHTFCDLGKTPLSNAFPLPEQKAQEKFYNLHAYVCKNCFLVQIAEMETPENIFGCDYAYFSSYSSTWLEHANNFAEKMIQKLALTKASKVIEIASNDGYLLQYFKQYNISILGIEPAKNVAEAAQKKGIDTKIAFFSNSLAQEMAKQKIQADLLIANNVLAHVPELNDFVKGLKKILKEEGTISIEFPHLLKLIEENQFDTIYHEHFSYFSLHAVNRIFQFHGLKIFDVEELPTHGGSLRIYAGHEENETKKIHPSVPKLLLKELASGLQHLKTYIAFNEKVQNYSLVLLNQLRELKKAGKTIVGYGAPAKGNTLLNFCKIGTSFFDYTVDRSLFKQNRLLPGTHIPIYPPEKILQTRPDFLFILPWNLKTEIMQQMAFIRKWEGKFIIPIPEMHIL